MEFGMPIVDCPITEPGIGIRLADLEVIFNNALNTSEIAVANFWTTHGIEYSALIASRNMNALWKEHTVNFALHNREAVVLYDPESGSLCEEA